MSCVLLTNPRSRRNRRDPGLADRLEAVLGARGTVIAPETVEALDQAVDQLAAADTLCIHGGDGTLHRVLTAFGRAGRALPPLVLLRGGTMNIVADSIGQRRGAEDALRTWAAGGMPRRVERCPLRVDVGGERVWGFLAGGGIISRFLELYYQTPDPTPASAGRLLARGALSALVGGRLARQLTRPFVGELVLDGQCWPGSRWTAVAVGSVEQLGLGFTPFPGVSEEPGRMHVIGIGSGIGPLALELPRVYMGWGLARSGNREARARSLELRSEEPIPFMVDGDFYQGQGRVLLAVEPPVAFHVL